MTASVRAQPTASMDAYVERLNGSLVDFYADPSTPIHADFNLPDDLSAAIDPSIRSLIQQQVQSEADVPTRVATIRALLQQAATLAVADAVLRGDLATAQRWRCELLLPRGVSASEGALLLDTLGQHPDKRNDAARLLIREAITWQTTRVRQLLNDALRAANQNVPLPGRLREQLAEATTLATLPPRLMELAGMKPAALESLDAQRQSVVATAWEKLPTVLPTLRGTIEARLPSLLSEKERDRQQRLLLKLVMLTAGEYSRGVRDGKVTVPLEYNEAVAFTRQANELLGELAPIWLSSDASQQRRDAVGTLEKALQRADQQIASIAPPDSIAATFKDAARTLQSDLGVNLQRRGTTADIVDEVMLETRNLLSQSLASALQGQWHDAEQLRLEAYTTYDPELEARLMPRDPQLASDIERLLLDGVDQPGVKVSLDKHAGADELQAAYQRVNDGLQKAAVMLKSDISPTAAVVNATSIVLREGLEGLLVIIAILAGLRGEANAHRRKLFWFGIVASMLATAVTWILSQTLVTSLRAYGELIEAIAGMVAIVVLLLITNWLFHQIYWKQWISALKQQAAEGESIWTLMMAGFAVGYREGFESVLFLQSLYLDAGGATVSLGVGIGVVALVLLGFAALWAGLKLPYFKLLLVTAGMIGFVLITFTGNTARALQTVGWIPVHRLTGGSWPMWIGTWLGVHNTVESICCQVAACAIVLLTWRIARMRSRMKKNQRMACRLDQAARTPIAACDPSGCGESADSSVVQISVNRWVTHDSVNTKARRNREEREELNHKIEGDVPLSS